VLEAGCAVEEAAAVLEAGAAVELAAGPVELDEVLVELVVLLVHAATSHARSLVSHDTAPLDETQPAIARPLSVARFPNEIETPARMVAGTIALAWTTADVPAMK